MTLDRKTSNIFSLAEDLLNLYVVLYHAKMKKKPLFHYGKLKFAVSDILKILDYNEVKDLLQYYVSIENSPNIETFVSDYINIVELQAERDADKKHRAALRNKTKERVEAFNAK